MAVLRETITTLKGRIHDSQAFNSKSFRDREVGTFIKKRTSKFLCAGVAVFVISTGVVRAADESDGGFLPNARIVSTARSERAGDSPARQFIWVSSEG